MKISIIGGGITGLATALALQKAGIESVVYEQAHAINEIGAGIWLQPNAVQVLGWLGIKDRVKEQGVELDQVAITDAQLRPYKKVSDGATQDAEGNRTIAIHRGRLQKILYQEVCKTTEVQLGKRYVKHTSHSEGVTVCFQDSQAEASLLIGADGIRSSVRAALFPQSALRDSGQVCWRGVSTMNLPGSLQNLGQEAWGNQIRFGFSPIYQNEVYWFAVAKQHHEKRAEKRGLKSYLTELFKGFAEAVPDLIRHTDASRIHQSAIQDLRRLPSWYGENECLLGDAAHATTPNMGQGACQGIEDAYYISQYLSRATGHPATAFQKFQRSRRKKVDYIVNTSWRIGKMAHSPIGQPFMKLMLKVTPERMLNTQMDKLYRI